MKMQERVRVEPGERVRIVGGRSDQTERAYGAKPSWLGLSEIKWGSVVAGLLTALTTLLILAALGAALGLTMNDAAAGAGQNDDRNAMLWAVLATAVAFLAGGYVAARAAGLLERPSGLAHGALVFMLAVPVILWLASQGAAWVGDALGGSIGGLTGSDNTGTGTDAGPGATDALRNAAWGAVAGSVIGLFASSLGGWLGSEHVQPRGHTDRRTYDRG